MSATASGVQGETGQEFLLRMRPSERFKVEQFGEFRTGQTILLSTPCSYSKASTLTKLITYAILPQIYGGLERNLLLLDLGYQLNMLNVLKSLEKRLKTYHIPNSTCDKVISASPSHLKVFRTSTSLELVCLLASIKETILHEQISIIVCNCSCIYNMDKADLDYLYSTLSDLPTLCGVTVIFVCYLMADLPAIRFPQPADIYWSITRSSSNAAQFLLSVKQKGDDGSYKIVNQEYSL